MVIRIKNAKLFEASHGKQTLRLITLFLPGLPGREEGRLPL
jgi:hypothetical protein